jgi:twinkle protein
MDDSSSTVISKGYCDKCGSDDNLVTYADGHSYCYSPGCGLRDRSDRGKGEAMEQKLKQGDPSKSIGYHEDLTQAGLSKRKITVDTARKYGYFIHKEGGKTFHIAPYFDQKGSMVYQKYRTADKDFWFEAVAADKAPKTTQCQLFGQHVYGEKNDRMVVITEGEIDAMSVAQAVNFKIPVVSIAQGVSSAEDNIKANYRWLDRFDSIIIWMDMDEPGQKVVPEIAELFDPGKVKVVNSGQFKDASEMLQQGKTGEIYQAVYAATTYSPAGIINAKDCASDMLEDPAVLICEYPWPILQDITKGIREKEVVYHIGGTGIGKTSIIVELQHMLISKGIRFGVMRFEDTRYKTQLDLMGRHSGRRLHLENSTTEERIKLHSEVFDSGLVEIFDPEVADWSLKGIFGYLRFMNKALGCKVVFIDPLSFLVAASDERDERKALDRLSYELAQMVKKTGLNLQITHHLSREQGKVFEEGDQISLSNIRGSAGIANFSMAVFAYERNQQGSRPDLTRVRVLKNRFAGTTGEADTLKWDDLVGSLLPTSDRIPEDDGDGSPKISMGSLQEKDY